MITTAFRGLHVHLMGIGGAGVSALAPLLQQAGAAVSGCDCSENSVVHDLRRKGVHIWVGHDVSHLNGVDMIVHTSAVPTDHPELAAARARGITVLGRAACLVRLMHGIRTMAVSGSHGKTSTTWMLGHLLTQAGEDPLVMVGGGVASLGGGGARTGRGGLFIAETDESDGSFALISPEIAIVTNLDHEHLRHYGSFEALEERFHSWLVRVPRDGAVILPHSGLSPRVSKGVRAKIIRCGLDQGDYSCTDLELGADGSRCRVRAFGTDLGRMTVTIPGAHMVLNALMAVAAARVVRPDVDLSAMSRCERVRRRFTVHGEPRGIRVVEDYGHHPNEVRATIAAARLAGGRVQVVFQPHRFTRTSDCFHEFVSAFDQADSVALLPIYAASEDPIAGVDSSTLAKAIAKRRAGLDNARLVVAEDDASSALRFITEHARPGDTCLLLGAGDVGLLAPDLVNLLAAVAA